MSPKNPRFGTITLHNLQGHSGKLITNLLPDITFKKTYCVPFLKLFCQKCPQLECAIAYCFQTKKHSSISFRLKVLEIFEVITNSSPI